jgi:hypothetical protein
VPRYGASGPERERQQASTAPRPKPKSKPKPRPQYGASGPERQRQEREQPVQVRQRAAAVNRARPPAPPVSRAAPMDELDAIIAKHTKGAAAPKAKPAVTTAGLARIEGIRGNEGGSFVGGFLKNLGEGATRVITNAPAGAQWAAQNTAYPFLRGIELATGQDESLVTKEIGQQAKAGFKGLAADYKYRYGPLASGNVKEFGSRFYQDPLPTILDVGGAYSAAGRAPAAAARAGAAVTGGRVAERLAAFGSRSRVAPNELYPGSPAGKLHRPPRQTVGTAAGESEKGKLHTAGRVTEVPRRPFSPNAGTRAGQRGADRLRANITPRIERAAERRQVVPGEAPTTGSRLTKRFTAQAKFDRAQARGARDIVFRREQIAAGVANRDIAPFAEKVRRLKPDRTPAGVKQKGLSTEQIALRMHLEDMLAPRAGRTAGQLRDMAVTRMEKGVAKAEARGERTELTPRQIEQVRKLPDELLTLNDMSNPAVRRVAEALQEGRKLDEISQARAIKSGTISEATAKEMKGRTAALLLGGQEWAPAILKEMKAAGIPKPYRDMLRTTSVRETPKLRQMREKLGGLDADLRNAGRIGEPTITAIRKAKRDEYFKKVRNEENRNLGFTHVPRPEMVRGQGVYIPKTPIDKMGTGGTFARRRGFSGPMKAKQSKGYLTQKGGFDMNPNLLAHQAKRAIDNAVGPMSPAALEELVGLAAYVDEGGMMVSGQRAAQMARHDPDRVVLVNKKNLRDALRKLDDLEEGKYLDPADVKMFYGQGESWLQAIPEGKITGEYVAISKAAADVWREAPTTNPILKGSDTFLDYWKGGILALSPRWYVNSALGISFQYGLLTLGDVRSVVQAVRKGPIRDAVPDEVVLNNLAHDVGMKGGVNVNKLQRAFEIGFTTNNRMESAWRRAAYINRAKKALRDEGQRFRGLKPEEIARAIDQMPPSVARNVVRDVDLFLGEFRKFNRFEREVMKRVLPFYSWLRVISRLTLSLPARSPVRAEAVAVLGRAAEYGINPDDYKRPLYERGAIKIGKYRIPTTGFSPPGALLGAAEAATNVADDPASALGIVGEEALTWAHPVITTGLASIYGTTPYGRSTLAPTGYAGTVGGYGGPERVGVSGALEPARNRIPLPEALLSALAPAPTSSSAPPHPVGGTPTTRRLPPPL